MTSIHPDQIYRQALGWLDAYGGTLLLAGMGAALAFMIGSFLIARRKGHTERWVSTITSVVVLGFMSEGMWEVAREKLHLPPHLAIFLFFVAEAMFVTAAMHARRHYRDTTEWSAPDDEGHRRIVTHGHPGKHGNAVWVVAISSGLIVASNSTSLGEVLLRFALPVGAAYMWWSELTADGTGRPTGTWRWGIRRILVRIGAIDPSGAHLDEVDRERRVVALVVTATRVHDGARPVAWHKSRRARLLRSSDAETVAEAARRLRVIHRADDLLDPASTADLAEFLRLARSLARPGGSTGRAGERVGESLAGRVSGVGESPAPLVSRANGNGRVLPGETPGERVAPAGAPGGPAAAPTREQDYATALDAYDRGELTLKRDGTVSEQTIRDLFGCGAGRARDTQKALNAYILASSNGHSTS